MSKFLNFHDVPVSALDELVQSGDIELGRGNVISKIDIRADTGLYPIYSSSAKNNGMMGKYGKFMFDEEMVTWSVDGGGKFFYRPKHKFSVTNVSGYMRANHAKFDYKFLHGVLDYQHSFLNFDYQSKAHPSVIRELYDIPIPPLPEQKKIASILTSVDEVIESTQKQIDKFQDLKKATMNELLTKGIGHTEFKDIELGRIPKSWSIFTIFELGDKFKDTVQTGPFGAQLHAEDYVEEGIPLILIRNIKGNELDEANMPKITEEDAIRLSKYRLQEGDIVFSRVGRVGSCFLTTYKEVGWVISGQTLRMRTNKKRVYGKFLLYALQAEDVQKSIIGASVGSTRTSINTSILENLKVKIPNDIAEQKKIASILTSSDELIENTQKKMNQLQSLKKSLMQDLLTGKVRVTVN